MINIDDLKTGDFIEENDSENVGIIIKEQNKVVYKDGYSSNLTMLCNGQYTVFITKVYRDKSGFLGFDTYKKGELIYVYEDDLIERLYNKEILTQKELSDLMASDNIKIIEKISNEQNINAILFRIEGFSWAINSLWLITFKRKENNFMIENIYLSQPIRVKKVISIDGDYGVTVSYQKENKNDKY